MECPHRSSSVPDNPIVRGVDLSFCHGKRNDKVVTRVIADIREELANWQVVTDIVPYGQSREKREEHSYPELQFQMLLN